MRLKKEFVEKISKKTIDSLISKDLIIWEEVSIPSTSEIAEINIPIYTLDGYPVYSAIGDNFGNLWIGAADGLYILPDQVPIVAQNANTSIDDVIRVSNESCILSGDCKKELMIYPNPYFPNQGNTVKFLLESTSQGNLEIYDFAGRKIDDVDCSLDQEPGYLVCHWNGYDKSSQRVSNGVYFCRLKVGGNYYWEKLITINYRHSVFRIPPRRRPSTESSIY